LKDWTNNLPDLSPIANDGVALIEDLIQLLLRDFLVEVDVAGIRGGGQPPRQRLRATYLVRHRADQVLRAVLLHVVIAPSPVHHYFHFRACKSDLSPIDQKVVLFFQF